MEKQTITFKADEQGLIKTGGITNYASNTVSYIEATFVLGANWTGFDSVRAIWANDYRKVKSTVLDGSGKCIVPAEILTRTGKVTVNLVGSVVENDTVSDRLTTYPITAVIVDANARLDNDEPGVTPTQFEQFVAIVKDDADRAETAAGNADASAEQAEGYAGDAEGYMTRAEAAAEQAETEVGKIIHLTASAETLPAGSSATAHYDYDSGTLTLGIPQGETGATPNITIGSVTTLNPGEQATATITGTADNPVLNLGIPKGAKGDTGVGIESIYETGTSGAVHTYTILYTNGNTTTFNVTDGQVTNAALAAITGDLANLTTTDKSNLVAAINELVGDTADLKEDLTSISPEMTSFVERTVNAKTSTVFSDIDANYKTYSGMVFSNTGTFASSSAWNTYAFISPYDGFSIKLNAQRVCISNSYPDADAGTIDIASILKYGTDAVDTITIPHKGDIVVMSIGTSTNLLMLTTVSNPTEIKTLYLSEENDRFALASVNDSNLSVIGNDKLNITKKVGMLANVSTAGYSQNASYTSWYFRVPVPELTIKCTNGFRCVIGYDEPSETSQNANLKEVKYQYEAGRVDTFTAIYGDWVLISVANTNGDIALETDLVARFELPALRLGFRQENSFYTYAIDGDSKYLFIYYKSGNKYVRWQLHNVPSSNINSNTWQIGKICGVDEDLSNEVELVAGGEFEFAFKEHGASDFCGGNNHGDENTDTFKLFIDGKNMSDLSTLADGKYHAFNRIDAIEIATINRCDTPDEDILTHQKVWTFENGTVKTKQSLLFLEQLQVDGMLICMFAANRSSFKYGVRQGHVGIETMTDNAYTILRTKINDMFYEMYGDHVNAKIKANSFNDSGDSGLWINPTSVLNKLYFTYWENSNSTYPVTINANTILHWESEYDVAYN